MSRRLEMAGEAARLLQDGFVVLDFETTGFPTDRHVEIIEVGIIDHQGNILMNTLVKPRHPIPYGASRVNGIYDVHVEAAPPFEDVYQQLADLLHDKQVAAYNYSFEQGIINAVCRNFQVDYIAPSLWYCPMRSYQKFANSGKYFKLTVACSREDIHIENAHRALGDCLMTLELIKRMAKDAPRDEEV
jgi:DNA polymerase III subunit epsilon